MVERSTAQRIGDVEQMVTSFRRHLRAENKANQTVMACTHAPLQLVWDSAPRRVICALGVARILPIIATVS